MSNHGHMKKAFILVRNQPEYFCQTWVKLFQILDEKDRVSFNSTSSQCILKKTELHLLHWKSCFAVLCCYESATYVDDIVARSNHVAFVYRIWYSTWNRMYNLTLNLLIYNLELNWMNELSSITEALYKNIWILTVHWFPWIVKSIQ